MDRSNDPAPIMACKLWAKTSRAGRTYFVGRLGGLRVVILENTRPDDGDHTHSLLFSVAPQYSGAYAPPERVEASPQQPAHIDRGTAFLEAKLAEKPAMLAAKVARKPARRGKAEPRERIDDDVVPF